MAVIYSYPIKSTPDNDDLILISDGTDNLTKQVRVSTLPGGSAAGVSSFNTLTGAVTITGGTNVTLNTVGNNIEINAAGGSSGISVQGAGGTPITGITTLNFRHNFAVGAVGTTATMDVLPYGNDTEIQLKNGTAFGASPNLTFNTNILTVEHTAVIKGQGTGNPSGKLKLNCEENTHALTLEGPAHSGGADYTLKFPSPAPSNQQILQSDGSGVLSWINTPSSGGGGSVDSVNTTDGTFINLTPNSATTGAVTVTADLSAVDGTSTTTTKFLSKNNTWDVPSYTTDTTYSAGTGLSLNGTTFSLATNAALTNLGGGTGTTTFLRKDGTWVSPTTSNTNIGGNNLTLTNNRTLNFYSDTTDKSLTFIGGDSSGTKTLFKFDTVTNKPRLTIGDTASTYEGTLDIKGNGSNRTGKINLYNAAGTYSINIQAPTTFGASLNIPYVLPDTQGGASTFLQNNGSGTLTWAAPTTAITLTTTGSSGAATWDGTTLNIPQYSGGGGSSASLGFTPLSIYAADDTTTASYTYYCMLVCDVDITLSTSAKAKVFVRSGTSAIYAALYSTTSSNMQTSSFTRLCTFSKLSGVASGINTLAVDSTVTLTAGQTVMLGFSSANQMAGGGALNSNILSVAGTSLTTSFPASIADIENTTSANKRVAIHIYES